MRYRSIVCLDQGRICKDDISASLSLTMKRAYNRVAHDSDCGLVPHGGKCSNGNRQYDSRGAMNPPLLWLKRYFEPDNMGYVAELIAGRETKIVPESELP